MISSFSIFTKVKFLVVWTVFGPIQKIHESDVLEKQKNQKVFWEETEWKTDYEPVYRYQLRLINHISNQMLTFYKITSNSWTTAFGLIEKTLGTNQIWRNLRFRFCKKTTIWQEVVNRHIPGNLLLKEKLSRRLKIIVNEGIKRI